MIRIETCRVCRGRVPGTVDGAPEDSLGLEKAGHGIERKQRRRHGGIGRTGQTILPFNRLLEIIRRENPHHRLQGSAARERNVRAVLKHHTWVVAGERYPFVTTDDAAEKVCIEEI